MKISKGFTPTIQSFILATEGGYVDHPQDPGGATNYGITFAVLQAWRKHIITKKDVKALTKKEALEIYKANYWDVMQCSKLPLGLDYMVMDYGVNSGQSRAIKDLQRTVGINADGILGAKTLDAIDTYIEKHGITLLLKEYATKRWNFMQSLSFFNTFKRGWKIRVWGKLDGMQTSDVGVVDRALKLANGVADSDIPMPEVAVGSAIPEKATTIDMLKDPTTLTGVAGAGATILGVIQNQPILQIGAILAIVAIVAYYLYKKRNADPS